MSNLADLSAVELVSAYKAKSLSPVEVTEAVIARIEAYEPKLNALWAYDANIRADMQGTVTGGSRTSRPPAGSARILSMVCR